MRVKRLHTNSKIFFPNPYVVRIEFPDNLGEANNEYRKIIRSAYKLLNGTWGYSALEMESWYLNKEGTDSPFTPFAGMTQAQILSSFFDSNLVSSLRGYICFADEEDALQFRLSLSVKSVQVKMWPKKEFTIHEVVEVDES